MKAELYFQRLHILSIYDHTDPTKGHDPLAVYCTIFVDGFMNIICNLYSYSVSPTTVEVKKKYIDCIGLVLCCEPLTKGL